MKATIALEPETSNSAPGGTAVAAALPRLIRTRSNQEETCYHGGAFFEAIGSDFDQLGKRHQIINADVLDAWFDPSPRVTAALTEHLPWLIRTSPPTHSDG